MIQFVLAMALLWTSSSVPGDPDIVQKLVRKYDDMHVSFAIDGSVHLEKGAISMMDYVPFGSLLLHDEVQKEIELSDSQSKEVARLSKKQATKFVQTIREQFPDAPHDPMSHGVCEAYYEESLAKLNEILLPPQFDRLEQIHNQLVIRSTGFIPFLITFADERELPIDLEKQEEVKQFVRTFREEGIPKLQKKCTREFDRLYDVLTRKQKRQLDEVLSRRNMPELGPDITLAQLKFALTMENDFSSIKSDWSDQSEYFAKIPSFSSLFDGTFAGTQQMPDQASFWIGEFEGIARTTTDVLPVPEADLEAMKEFYVEFRHEEQVDSANHEMQMETQPGYQTKTAYLDYFKRYAARREKFATEFFELLSPVGKQVFLDFYAKRSDVRYGVFASLLNGPLGTEIELTAEQKEQLRKQIEKVISNLESEFREAEAEFQDSIFKITGKELEKKYREAVGPPMKHISPTFLMLTAGVQGQ